MALGAEYAHSLAGDKLAVVYLDGVSRAVYRRDAAFAGVVTVGIATQIHFLANVYILGIGLVIGIFG